MSFTLFYFGNLNFNKLFLLFKEILQKHPDDLKKYVVNKGRELKNFKEIFQKVAKSGSRFETSIG